MPNSNTRSIQVGSEDNTLLAAVYNADGSIKTDLAHDTTGISIFVQRIGEANGSALTLSAKATPQTAHADGAFLNLGGGDISVDVPDAPFATYKGRARIYGTFTGGTIIGEWFDVVGFDASVVAVGANTTTPTNLSAAQVRTELATELARIDATISSRSTFAGLGTNAPASWINAAAIATDTITAAKIASNAITDAKIASNAITSAKIAASAIGASQIASNAITDAKINNGAFTAAKFAAGAFDAVWTVSTRTLTSFGTLVTDIWAAATRTLTTVADSAGVTTLLSRLSSTRADYLDKLNVSGTLAHTDNAATFRADVSGLSTLDAAGVRSAIGLASANLDTQLVALPTNTQFEARTIPAADYFDPAVDIVARVTLVDTCTANSDMRGTDNALLAANYTAPTNLSAAQVRTELATELARIDQPISSRSTFNAGSDTVTVGTNNDKTGYSLSQAFPSNFASLGINASGHISRVVLVDTTTANTDMRGTDNALLASGYTAPDNTGIGDLVSRLTSARAGYLDKLNVSGTLAHTDNAATFQADVSGLSTLDAAGVWSHATRTLTSATGGGATAQEVWEYADRTLTGAVTVGTNNDKTGYALTQAFPSNFASLGINSDGHISRVVLVDTTTANTDMRGTDNALLASSYTAPLDSTQTQAAAAAAITASVTAEEIATFAKQDEIIDLIKAGELDQDVKVV